MVTRYNLSTLIKLRAYVIRYSYSEEPRCGSRKKEYSSRMRSGSGKLRVRQCSIQITKAKCRTLDQSVARSAIRRMLFFVTRRNASYSQSFDRVALRFSAGFPR